MFEQTKFLKLQSKDWSGFMANQSLWKLFLMSEQWLAKNEMILPKKWNNWKLFFWKNWKHFFQVFVISSKLNFESNEFTYNSKVKLC